MGRKRKRGGGGTYSVQFYREECKTSHGFDISKCDDGCDIVELEYEVAGNVSAYDPGVCSGPVERCYPPEGGEVEIESITLDGKEVDVDNFSQKELEKMDEDLAQAMMDDDGGDDYDDSREDDRSPDSWDPSDRDYP